MSLVKLTVQDFIIELASANPTPGGGSASALAGAMAAAMVEMSCNLTVGREKYQAVEAEMQTVLARATELREKLLAAVDEDTEAFDVVSRAYKMPKGTEEEKTQRTAAIQQALKRASEVPLGVAQASAELAQLAAIAQEKANPNVASDARVARLLAEAARDGAAANVEINISSLTDTEYVNWLRDGLAGLANG
jgi:formiminotetrahydrofolate cyclodeaminase